MENQYVRFDWAAKRMLRDKANFAVLEGLMTVLIGEPMKIVELLESESNQEHEQDKFNRVDVKARNSKGEIVIVEIQQTRELYFLQRLLYGVSKTVTDHMSLGERYDQVKKVYSISILYFDLGEGSDYLYHGRTTFTGVHTHDTLKLSEKAQNQILITTPESIFPEYYIIRVNEFNKVATTPLEEWIDYLKSGHIKEDTEAPGLDVARQRLQYLQMSADDRRAYERHLDNLRYQNSVFDAAHLEGHEIGYAEGIVEGRAEGIAQGKAEGRAEGIAQGKAEGIAQGKAEGINEGKLAVARQMKAMGIAPEVIIQATGIDPQGI